MLKRGFEYILMLTNRENVLEKHFQGHFEVLPSGNVLEKNFRVQFDAAGL